VGFSPDCRDCPRLARFLDSVRLAHPDYHAAPVAPFGDGSSRLLVVGLAPGMHGANRTGRPFTGDHAGILLYRTLYGFGFASAAASESRSDGLQLIDCRITNAVKCLPPANKPERDEIGRCNRYLQTEMAGMPRLRAVLALGRIAHDAVLLAVGMPRSACKFGHGAAHPLQNGMSLFDSYHCSRYNTQTKRLTGAMFEDVFSRIRAVVDAVPAR
jgi:uracil-DNA glycosylase family 4